MDGDGNVCVATLGSGGITSLSPDDGSVVEFVETGDIFTTNLGFGGEDLPHRVHHGLGHRPAAGDGVAPAGAAARLRRVDAGGLERARESLEPRREAAARPASCRSPRMGAGG